MSVAIDLILTGRVQGVGFRPFVYRLAHEIGIRGWVRNTVGRVEIHAEGSAEDLDQFRQALVQQAPPLSDPQIELESPGENQQADGFFILRSEEGGEAAIHIPADQYLCADCEKEFQDPTDRRYQYPFINCTQCGPRYTIIQAMPYDRTNTSMAPFSLCAPCLKEYEAPDNRRFHAEPNACGDCGPHLSYYGPDSEIHKDSSAALRAAVQALEHGRILAVKGVGGYHLMCDASNEVAVARLRKNKHRPHKPLALMVSASGELGMGALRELVDLDTVTTAELRSQSRPIILLTKKDNAPVCDEIAPGLNELGVMLPPSPMHELLMTAFGRAVVATSGNISGEPVLTDDEEASTRLDSIAEGWLTHDRAIVRPADDTVKRYIAGAPRMIRPGRGSAPLERQITQPLPRPVIALGGHMKDTVTLAWDDRAVVSSHIGDLEARRSQVVFEQVIEDLQRLYQVEAEVIVCDQHPQYSSTRWAQTQEKPIVQVQHHRAHASALAGEHQRDDLGLVFSWDGVGLGDDGSLWGGETFMGSPGSWERTASLRPFRLLGGDRVSREPWRSAAALHWELEREYKGQQQEKLAHAAWVNGVNVIPSSAAGRLFDAAAAILGLVHEATHEGEAPMCLEAIAERVDSRDCLPVYVEDQIQRIDWQLLFEALIDQEQPISRRAGYFHAVLANTICELAQQARDRDSINYVGLTGGVFQNRLLTELIVVQLQALNIECLLHTEIPANDGGLSYGQVIEYQARESQC